MKIIIAGAGAVGTHLAQLLSKDDHDIVVIDESSDKTDMLTESGNYDLMTINLPPTSIAALKEAGVQHAQLFIAVTPDESRNLNCCMLAHTLGAKKTVARVDNAEYVQQQYRDIFSNMGIDSLIYPEMLASQEIIEGLHHSWVRQYWEIHNGALIMMGIKLRETAKILDIPLRELCPPDAPYHIVTIKRDYSTIIPGGNDMLRLGDIAYFITTRKHASLIRQLVGKEEYPDVKNVMVMGGGRISVQLAHNKPDWISMRIVEQSEERCLQLNDLLENDDIVVIHGDGRDTGTLVDEGIKKCQAFAALTPETETNILACLAAKRLGVRKTVALVENMDYVNMAEMKLNPVQMVTMETPYGLMLSRCLNSVSEKEKQGK
jgi:trk system potassium uptake protein TrkA